MTTGRVLSKPRDDILLKKAKPPRLSKESWRAHRRIIYRKYVVDGLPLSAVRQYMVLNHAFHAKEHQYVVQLDRWGYLDIPPRQASEPTRPLPNKPGESSAVLIDLRAAQDWSEGSGPGCPDEHDEASHQLDDCRSSDHDFIDCAGQVQVARPPEGSGAPDDLILSSIDESFKSGACGEDAADSLTEVSALEHDPRLTIIPECTTDNDDEVNSASKAVYDASEVVSPTQSTFLTALQRVLRHNHLRRKPPAISDDDVTLLIRSSNFLFATGSYSDSFAVSQVTQNIVEKLYTDPGSTSPIENVPAWLLIVTNMARATTCLEDFKDLLQVLSRIGVDGIDIKSHNKEYGLLFAYLGCATYRTSGHPRAKRIAAASWNKLRSMPPPSYLVTRRIVEPAIEDIMDGLSHIQPGLLTQKEFRQIFCVSSADTKTYIGSGQANNDVKNLLRWVSDTLAQDEFIYMIYKVDLSFWLSDRSVDKQQAQQFELILVHCYLCERMWRASSSQVTRSSNATTTTSTTSVNIILERIRHHIGLSHEDIISAFVRLLAVIEPSAIREPQRYTMTSRFRSAFEALHHKCTLNNLGYMPDDPPITLDKIIEQHTWPGKTSASAECFDDAQYRQRVHLFLRNFLNISLELDLSQRLTRADGDQSPARGQNKTMKVLQTIESSIRTLLLDKASPTGDTVGSDEFCAISEQANTTPLATYEDTGLTNHLPVIQSTPQPCSIKHTKSGFRNFSRKLTKIHD